MKSSFQSAAALKNACASFAKDAYNMDYSFYSDEKLREELAEETKPVRLAAMVSEVIFRKTGLRLFACQLETAAALFNGHITELPTGEGKTLAAVVAAVLYAKQGRKVHVLVFNDYLAKRDGQENAKIFEFCGLRVAYINETTTGAQRKAAYDADILYIPAREAGYDYLRNFIATDKDALLGGTFDVAIVDEADSILIDEASIPLVLAGKSENAAQDDRKIIAAVRDLSPEDSEISEQDNQIWLTDSGISKIEQVFMLDNLYGDENIDILAAVNTALEAVYILKKDKDYIVKDGKIAVIDESTGRIAVSRKFPNTLHKFVEAKEGIEEHLNTKIYCSMTIGAFIELYQTVCGMTGTAATSASEFESAYGLRTVVVEPHTSCIRIDHEDEIFANDDERDKAVLETISAANVKGQPVLIGTASVMESEHISTLLTENCLPHTVLNARNDELEAEIIANAGKPYCITVSTNMAGRGVDIKLGGADESQKAEVEQAGGLYVISTTVNRSRRIDNQLRGRAGRQGDMGESKFFISLTDATIAPFFEDGDDGHKKLTENEKFALVRSAQKTLEGNEAEARYTLKKYSYIIEYQRKELSEYREKLLLGTAVADILRQYDLDKYLELEKTVGKKGIELAERALSLYYINAHFANYLEAMEEIKSGIHLTMVAGKNPFDEFNRAAVVAFDEMNDDIRFDVLQKMQTAEITADGIDLSGLGLIGATGTWTYMVDDTMGQFSHLPALMQMVSKKIKTALSFGERFERFLNRKKNKEK